MITFNIILNDFEPKEEVQNGVLGWGDKYPRIVELITIPLLAVASFRVYRKSKLFFAEHLVVATYALSMQIVIDAPVSILELFVLNKTVLYVLGYLHILPFVYWCFYYYRVFAICGVKKKRKTIKLLLYFFLVTVVFVLFLEVLSRVNYPILF